MSSFDIKLILPPPIHAFESVGASEWAGIESKLGTLLPEDYKNFIQLYGSGRIDEFIWILNPGSANENTSLIEQARVQLDVLRELQSEGEIIPYSLFPSEGGILPFGITDNGDVLFWRTVGAPENWTVVVNESRSPDWEEFDMPMEEFLFGILTRSISCNIFPKSFPSASPAFEKSY